jgi:hypothetical protein
VTRSRELGIGGMWRWMKRLLDTRPRELPLAKRDLLHHAHVDGLPTRWTEQSFSTALEWSSGRMAARRSMDPPSGFAG